MKVMKNYLKVIFCFIAFAILSFAFAFSPTMTAFAGESYALASYNRAIQNIKIAKNVDASQGETLNIPLLSGIFGSSYTIRVTDPAGQYKDYVSGAEADTYFTLLDADKAQTDVLADAKYVSVSNLTNGTYDVMYIINTTSNQKFYSTRYFVQVKNVSYGLDFTTASGEKLLMPSVMKASANAQAYKVVMPRVKNLTNDEYDTSASPVVSIKFKNKDEGIDLNTDLHDTVAELSNVNLTNVNAFKFDGEYYIVPRNVGNFTIEYAYNYGSNAPIVTRTIKVKDASDYEDPMTLKLTVSKPKISGFQLGKTGIELPKLTVSDENSNNIEHNVTKIEITNLDTNVSKTLENNTYTFDLTKSFFEVDDYNKLVGDYEVKYTVKDAYGRTDSVTVKVLDVTDSTKPSVYMAYDYEVDTDENGKITAVKEGTTVDTDYAVNFRPVYGWDEIVLPAMYAEDMVTELKDMTFVRYLQNVNTGKNYYIDNVKVGANGGITRLAYGDEGWNYAYSEGQAVEEGKYPAYNKAVAFKFENGEDHKGEKFELRYYVLTNTVKSQNSYLYQSGSTYYTFEIAETATYQNSEATTPTVEITSLKKEIANTENVTVKFTAKDDEDKAVKSGVYYYYSTSSSDVIADVATAKNNLTSSYKYHYFDDAQFATEMQSLGYVGFKQVTKNADGEYEFTLADYAGQTKVTVLVLTVNDYGNVASATKTLVVKNLTTDTQSPSYTIDSSKASTLIVGGNVEEVTINQNSDPVVLPTLTFNDDIDNYLDRSVKYYILEDANSKVEFLNPVGQQYPDSKTIVGGKINPTKAGTYYVVYTATDDAGNSTVVYFMFNVEDHSAPQLTVSVSQDGLKDGYYEAGSVVSLDAVLKASGVDVTDDALTSIDYTVEYSNSGKGQCDYHPTGETMTFQFDGAGTYTFKFNASYNGREAITQTVRIRVAEPKIVWENENVSVKEYANKKETIKLSIVGATYGNEKAEVTVKVTDKQKKEVTVNTAYATDGTPIWTFETYDKAETYTVVYTATATDGTSDSITRTVKVGDNIEPTITLSNQAKLEKDIDYTGEDLTYNINLVTSGSNKRLEITIKSGDKTIYTVDAGLSVTDNDDEGQTNNLSWSDLDIVLDKVSDDAKLTTITAHKSYKISSTGKYVLRLKISDENNNECVKEIKFNVVKKSTAKNFADSKLGIALIIVSTVLLVGLVGIFLFAGKKSSGKKSRKVKPAKEVSSSVKEVEESTPVVEESPVEESATVVEEAPEEATTQDTTDAQ